MFSVRQWVQIEIALYNKTAQQKAPYARLAKNEKRVVAVSYVAATKTERNAADGLLAKTLSFAPFQLGTQHLKKIPFFGHYQMRIKLGTAHMDQVTTLQLDSYLAIKSQEHIFIITR